MLLEQEWLVWLSAVLARRYPLADIFDLARKAPRHLISIFDRNYPKSQLAGMRYPYP